MRRTQAYAQGDCCVQKEGGTIKHYDFCSRPFLVSVHPSGRWIIGTVGIELLLNFTKSRVFTVLPTASQMNWSQMELTNTKAPVIDGEKRISRQLLASLAAST